MELPVRMEMDDAGSHRIVAWGRKGDWVGYGGISSLETPTGLLIAVTHHYLGVLPTETVLSVKPVFGGRAGCKLVKGSRPE